MSDNRDTICDLTRELVDLLKNGDIWLGDDYVDEYDHSSSVNLTRAMEILAELEELLDE